MPDDTTPVGLRQNGTTGKAPADTAQLVQRIHAHCASRMASALHVHEFVNAPSNPSPRSDRNDLDQPGRGDATLDHRESKGPQILSRISQLISSVHKETLE
ncbi:hypothetical protein BRAO375_3810001 [Bradyrhizobium sp. ORS 375]|nr:hypothetical protein BRAO375_3810001 [Bradyrhizobium sp. ORS 375]